MSKIYQDQHTNVHQGLFPRVFGWMFLGLLMTAIVAYILSQDQEIVSSLIDQPGILIGVSIANLVLVIVLSLAISRISSFIATLMFFTYAALNGVTFTLIFSYCNLGTVYSAFFITAGLFATFAIYGYVTRRDLSRIGSIALMFFIGIILATLINVFLIQNSFFQLIISYLIVGISCIVTAFDIQNIKNLAQEAAGEESFKKLAIIGALSLYLNFILIFRNLLYILSDD